MLGMIFFKIANVIAFIEVELQVLGKVHLVVALDQIIDRLTQSGQIPFALLLAQKKHSPITLMQNPIARQGGADAIACTADLHKLHLLRRLAIEDFIDKQTRLLHGSSMDLNRDRRTFKNARHNHSRALHRLFFFA